MQLNDATMRISIRHETALRGVCVLIDTGPPSRWARSRARRFFDISMVVAVSPVILPLLLAIGLAVRLTSPGPAVFRQTRVGPFGRQFTIFKFRTMIDANGPRRAVAAAAGSEQITGLGRFLRWLKLDELPQVLNVLRGDMSLVGPRPRIPEQQLGVINCRPGITSPATLAFAREDLLLARIPEHELGGFYMNTLLPVKQQLDREYMARATCLSDLSILLRTLLRRWDSPGIAHEDERLDSREPEQASSGYRSSGLADPLDS